MKTPIHNKTSRLGFFSMLLALLGLMSLSCEKGVILDLPQSELSFEAMGESRSVSFIATDAWEASANQDWCSVSPTNGHATVDNHEKLTIICDPNFSKDERSCTVTISSSGRSCLIEIVQSPMRTFQISPEPQFSEAVELICLIFRLAGAEEYTQCKVKQVSESADSYFASMLNHEAVSLAKDFRRTGVSYDAVSSFGVHLYITPTGKILFNDFIEKDSDASFNRWNLQQRQKMLTALNDFYQKSNFHEWYSQLVPLQNAAVESFKGLSTIDYEWFTRFFGPNNNLATQIRLSFLIGTHNNGIGFNLLDGRSVLSPVMGCFRQDGLENPYYDGDASILIHEFCHPYCNPLIDQYWPLMKEKAETIYKSVEPKMKAMAYGTPATMMYETFVRASVIRYLLAHDTGESAAMNLIEMEEQRGFVLIRAFVDALEKRERQQTTYLTMDDYMPELIKAMEQTDRRGMFDDYTYSAGNKLLPGYFSVSPTQKVQFTKGNLYWNGVQWKFESNQMNFPYSWNPEHVGHFFWTTTASSSYAAAYQDTPSESDRFFCDGGDVSHSLTVEGETGLRVLSGGKGGELDYMLTQRPNAENLYKVPVAIQDVGNCMVIAPDDYPYPIKDFYDPESWREAEAAGLVCLNPAGQRNKQTIVNRTMGLFWCGTSAMLSDTPDVAHVWRFDDRWYHPVLMKRSFGCSIRLVKDVPESPATE